MKLMFLHPVDYGRKAEELLWRKVYYEVIQVIKTNKKVTGIAAVGEHSLFMPKINSSNGNNCHVVTGKDCVFLESQEINHVICTGGPSGNIMSLLPRLDQQHCYHNSFVSFSIMNLTVFQE